MPESPDPSSPSASGTGAHPPPASKAKRILFPLIACAAALGASLATAEVLIRILNPQPLAARMYSDDPQFGFWNRPHLRKKAFQSEAGLLPYRITTDSQGYRGASPVANPKPPGTRRVVIVGDSFVFGVGVEDEETLPAQLESLLNAAAASSLPLPQPRAAVPQSSPGSPQPGAAAPQHAGRAFEVVNAGCPGWGTENALAFWRARGRSLNPDLLVVAFYRNDLFDNMRRMLFRIENGRLVFSPTKRISRVRRLTRAVPFYGFLCEHSHLLNLVRRAVAARLMRSDGSADRSRGLDPRGLARSRSQKAREKEKSRDADQTNGPPPTADDRGESETLRAQLEVYSRLMDALLADAQGSRVPVVLLLLPGLYDCQPSPFPHYQAVARLGLKWTEEDKIAATVDPRSTLMNALKEGQDVFLPQDGHFTAWGNHAVARALAERVQKVLADK
ncbi:MAG TPA: SGNH/GDSL hydrolase family protein [Sumerlaeia bacterium]|nr:SGNH/GDSL hydrolase family protein [Sumerlaeia bacterium]